MGRCGAALCLALEGNIGTGGGGTHTRDNGGAKGWVGGFRGGGGNLGCGGAARERGGGQEEDLGCDGGEGIWGACGGGAQPEASRRPI